MKRFFKDPSTFRKIRKKSITNREIILAALEGETVQIYLDGVWVDIVLTPVARLTTLDEPSTLYRIKPEE